DAEFAARLGPFHEAGAKLPGFLEKQVAWRLGQEIDTHFQRHQSQHGRRSAEEAVDVGCGLVFAGKGKRFRMSEPTGYGGVELFLQAAGDIQERGRAW